jgi:phosphopantetheine adenylyltransferase
MNSLVKALIQPILEAEGQKIALVPGGFKPPTMGHFYLVDEVAKDSNIDKVIVLIGHKNRDGVSKEESKVIWDIYKKYLPSNVEIQIADNSSPISDVASIIKNNPQNTYYPVVGIRGEMDLGDLKRFDSLKDKYDNFQTIVIRSEGEDRISGTNTRAALIGGEKERFQKYLPTELSDEEKEDVWSILQKTPVDEGTCGYNTDINTGKKLDTPGGIEEMYAEPSEFSYPPMIKSLTEYMLDKGMNIRPLPKVKFVNDDAKNAQNFFGKTAYYDPNNRVIVLYTMGRHPKDIMRSYAHEMVHHMQNCEDRLGNVSTTDINEDDYLYKLEEEANKVGTMTFRAWTDTLTEGVLGDKIVCDNCGWSWKIKDGGDDLYICHKCDHDNTPMSLNEGRYDKISNQISSAIFKYWKEDINNGAQASRLEQSFPFGDEEITIDANISVVPGLGKLNVDGGADDEEDYIQVRFEIDPTFLPKFWEEISMNLKDVIRHEIEHLTHGEGFTSNPDKMMDDDMFIRQMIDMEMLPKADYFKLEKEIDANLQGMYFRAKKEKRPFGDVINTYLDAQDITPEQKEEILDLWRRRLPALNLPKF